MGFKTGRTILIVYTEEGQEKRAIGILEKETDVEFQVLCNKNLLSIGKAAVKKAKQGIGDGIWEGNERI